MVFGKPHPVQDKPSSQTSAGTSTAASCEPTALYTYLNETLKSPELRRILEEGAAKYRRRPRVLGERDQVAQVVANSTLPYNNLQQTLALGILVLAKHDRAGSTHGATYTKDQTSVLDAFTPAEMDRFREQAGIMLNQFSAYLSIAKPEPRTRGDWWAEVWQGVVASWFYALSLIVVAGVFRVFGSDIITAIEWWTGKSN